MKGMLKAAGLGTRMLPLTSHIPKPMIPLLNIPLLRYGIELFKHHNIDEIAINTHYLADSIIKYLDEVYRADIHISHEQTQLGSFGGPRKMWDYLNESPVIVMNSDTVTTFDLTELINAHKEKEAVMTLGLKPADTTKNYTIIWMDLDHKILGLNGEKPTENAIATNFSGIKILEPEIKGWLGSGEKGEIIPLVFDRALKEKKPFFGHISEAIWLDGGEPANFIESNQILLDRLIESDPYFTQLLKRLHPSYRELSPGIWVGQETTLEATVVLKGPLLIGERCKLNGKGSIGPHTTIGDNVTISNVSELSNSIVLSNSEIKDSSHTNSILTPWEPISVPSS